MVEDANTDISAFLRARRNLVLISTFILMLLTRAITLKNDASYAGLFPAQVDNKFIFKVWLLALTIYFGIRYHVVAVHYEPFRNLRENLKFKVEGVYLNSLRAHLRVINHSTYSSTDMHIVYNGYLGMPIAILPEDVLPHRRGDAVRYEIPIIVVLFANISAITHEIVSDIRFTEYTFPYVIGLLSIITLVHSLWIENLIWLFNFLKNTLSNHLHELDFLQIIPCFTLA